MTNIFGRRWAAVHQVFLARSVQGKQYSERLLKLIYSYSPLAWNKSWGGRMFLGQNIPWASLNLHRYICLKGVSPSRTRTVTSISERCLVHMLYLWEATEESVMESIVMLKNIHYNKECCADLKNMLIFVSPFSIIWRKRRHFFIVSYILYSCTFRQTLIFKWLTLHSRYAFCRFMYSLDIEHDLDIVSAMCSSYRNFWRHKIKHKKYKSAFSSCWH